MGIFSALLTSWTCADVDVGNIVITVAVTAIVTAVVTGLGAYIKALLKARKQKDEDKKESDDNTHDGLQSVLRNDLIQAHEKYVELGFCPVYVKDSIMQCYKSYHNLGGNGVIDKLYQDILNLPEKPTNKQGE